VVTAVPSVPGGLPKGSTSPPPEFHPAPEGPRVAFVGKQGITTMRLDGSDVRPLTNASAPLLSWSPDHQTLLVLGGQSYGVLVSLDVKTGSTRTLLDLPDWDIKSADFSPDGSRIIVWASDRASVHADDRPWDRLILINADGSGLQDVSAKGIDPVWSPDGTRILLQNCDSTVVGSFDCTVRPDGTDPRPIPNGDLVHVNWSPDGQWIVGLQNDVVVALRVDGTEKHRVAVHSGAYRPAWSQDSTKVLYAHVSNVSGGPTVGDCKNGCDDRKGIFAVNLDGTGDVQLTNGPDYSPVIPRR
jgi:Tol biopolymer transport system component